MYDSVTIIDAITVIIGLALVFIFIGMAGRIKKIYFILDYFYQMDKRNRKEDTPK